MSLSSCGFKGVKAATVFQNVCYKDRIFKALKVRTSGVCEIIMKDRKQSVCRDSVSQRVFEGQKAVHTQENCLI